jgi:hypothetical protein
VSFAVIRDQPDEHDVPDNPHADDGPDVMMPDYLLYLLDVICASKELVLAYMKPIISGYLTCPSS